MTKEKHITAPKLGSFSKCMQIQKAKKKII